MRKNQHFFFQDGVNCSSFLTWPDKEQLITNPSIRNHFQYHHGLKSKFRTQKIKDNFVSNCLLQWEFSQLFSPCISCYLKISQKSKKDKGNLLYCNINSLLRYFAVLTSRTPAQIFTVLMHSYKNFHLFEYIYNALQHMLLIEYLSSSAKFVPKA